MQRKLASVQRVLGVDAIANADAIESVRINGWQCVTKKGEFIVGSLGVFFEIDAIPPDDSRFRFLWSPKGESITRPETFRIRTMRLRGALSQGLFLPLSAFPEIDNTVAEGDDLTESLGVGKYEPPMPMNMGNWRGPFPPMVPKTDEMRVQSVPQVLDELAGKPYAITLKYDGTSATFVIDPRTDEFHVASRNQSLKDGDNPYWNMARKYAIEAVLRRNPNLAIQGEIVGPGIQKNLMGRKEVSLFVFNVYDIVTGEYLSHDEAHDFLRANSLSPVETVEVGETFAHTQETLLALAEGKYPGTTNEREGIVIRPLNETFSVILGSRLSFKGINNRYLLTERD